MRAKVRARLLKNRIIAFFVGIVAVFFCIVLITQIINVRNQNKELEARSERLKEQVQVQLERKEELDDDEEYVKTREYIEEKAKAIGYVYPDEIIFKQED